MASCPAVIGRPLLWPLSPLLERYDLSDAAGGCAWLNTQRVFDCWFVMNRQPIGWPLVMVPCLISMSRIIPHLSIAARPLSFDLFVYLHRPYHFFVSIGILGGFTGRWLSYAYIQRYNRSSVIIVALVLTLGISCIAYIYRLAAYQSDFDFHTYCYWSTIWR